MTNQDHLDTSRPKTYTANERMSTPEEMVRSLKKELKITPKRKFLKRMTIKSSIEFWRGQS